MKKGIKKVRIASSKPKLIGLAVFAVAFAGIGGAIILATRAAVGVCSTSNVIGTATATVSVPEAAQYRLWVRMQVPDATNTNNLNGVRVELVGANSQCFTVTTTASNAVNAWQWVNTDANAASTAHITDSLPAGNYTAKILGTRAGVKVDKVLLLKSDNTCTPSNTVSGSVMPGDNCTTPVATATITADSTSLAHNTGTTIRWNSANATGCVASGGSGSWAGARATNGTFSTGNLTSTQTYSIICTGAGGQSQSQSVTVNVAAPATPTASISALNPTVVTGNGTVINWSSTNATSCTGIGGSNGWAGTGKPISGTFNTGNLTSNQTYRLTCSGAGGTSTEVNTVVTVTAAPQPNDTTAPTVSFTIPGVTVPANNGTVLVQNLKGVTWQPFASDGAGSGIKSLVLTVNGQTVTGTSIQVGVAANGNYELRAVATDNADLTTTLTVTIRIRHPDVNRDNNVNSSDITQILLRWQRQLNGQTVPASELAMYDMNANGTINSSDMTPILLEWARLLGGQ